MRLFCCLSIAIFVAGCYSPPKIPTDSASVCMIQTAKSIVEARNAHAQLKGNISKEGQCSTYAHHQNFMSNLGNKSNPNLNNAAGQVVIQSITSVNTGNSIYNQAYSECLRNPNLTTKWAPPAYSQFEKTLFGLGTIKPELCPANFKQDFEQYKIDYTELVNLSKSFPTINTSQWADIVKLKIPGNKDEQAIIENDKNLGQAYSNMIQKIRNQTGWCPSADMKSYYPCK